MSVDDVYLGVVSGVCGVLAVVGLVVYLRNMDWRSTPFGPWVVAVMGLWAARYAITFADVWWVLPPWERRLVSVWDSVVALLHLALIVWLIRFVRGERAGGGKPPSS